jgi:hypothetical protein
MGYADLLSDEGVQANYFAVLRPCRKVSTWTLFSGSVYSAAFDYGFVTSVEIDGTALTAGSSSSLSAGQFYWDDDNETLYVRASDSGNVNSDFVVVVYEIYVGTYDGHWYRVPTDDTTKQVYFEPLIARVPAIKSTVKELAFGVLPVQSTGIVLNNADKILNRHLYDGSFRGREILVYHLLDTLSTSNFKLVMRGRMDAIDWRDSTVSIRIFDSMDVFDAEFRSPQGTSFYSSSDYADLDPQFEGKPIRYVYGVKDGFVPVNVSFQDQDPTISNNRTWKVCSDGLNQYEKHATVPASPASTNTRTYVNSAAGFTVGDTARINKSTDESVLITGVNYTSNNYIEHAALASGAASAGDVVSRGTVSRIDIIHQGTKYTALYGRDYTESVDGNGVIGFAFSSSLESDLSMPGILSPSDTVYCRVYGKQNNVTSGGSPYGSNDSETGNIAALPIVLLDVLKRFTGLSEDQINLASFTALLTTADDRIALSIPENSTEKFPKLREIVSDICQTGLVSLYQDEDLKWAATRLSAVGAASGSIEDDEILDKSIGYSFSYGDIYSDVVVSFARRERSDNGVSTGFSLERAESTTARYLHKVNRTLQIESLHYDRDHANRLATRLAALYGDRQGLIEFDTKNRFFGFTIDEIIEISRKSLPGFEFDSDTLRTRSFNIRELEKSLRRVRFVLNDLKGVNENSGDF